MGKKEIAVSGNTISLQHARPVTRAIASALRASSKLITSSQVAAATNHNQGRVLRANGKRRAFEDDDDDKNGNAPTKKKRALLKDITNVTSHISYATSCFSAPKIQVENIKQIKKGRAGSSKVASSSPTSQVTDDAKLQAVTDSVGVSLSSCYEASCSSIEKPSSRLPPRPLGRRSTSTVPKFIDIDSDVKDSLLCSLYAPDIYYNLRVAELKRRPCPDFMGTTQRDVTQTMRGILIDWLVEVSEEYTLASDTLYLTMYLIDWFLQGNCMERQRLQLLGITCMLIASEFGLVVFLKRKYEEINAPRIEELCFITDNTYTRDEVLEMESQVLKHFSFQIYTPTSKTFLRRFLRAAQASHLMMPSVEMEFLANYLTELTLIECQFLKYLPSVIAASAVFLARWTINQSSHPWNATLEHYTTYKASDLKECVQALQDLQLNTKGCPLNSIRMKYMQDKFKSVAVFTSPKIHERLF
ncbi:cyclin-A2-4-like isoform X2 [Raphanus sativus]|uniref:Cyclin-A2-4-like isoform X2 n=1 Tax=Raphanus sativus TaxID=3726 RepID=A0A9W3CEU6_RAPSA|nr:cyclin-A2-4-like isoform X2 [Raphanus sativus]